MRVHDVRLLIAGAAVFALSAMLFAQGPQAAGAGSQAFNARDLSGVWGAARGGGPGRGGPGRGNAPGAGAPAARGNAPAALPGDPGGNEPAMTAWAEATFNANKPSNGPRTVPLDESNDPVLKSCLPPGTPRIYLHPFPMQIVQTPKETIMLFEYDHTVRHIYTDGRKHPDDLAPTYMGHSVGTWDGDTFVVDSVGFNDKTWLDREGHPHSDQLHVVERFRRVSPESLQIEITMEDPKALARPWVRRLNYQFRPTWDLQELTCNDNLSYQDKK